MTRDVANVVRTTWNWREGQPLVSASTSLRRAAVIQGLVMGAIAAGLTFGLGHAVFGRIVAILAGLVVLVGLFLPSAYRHVHEFGRALGRVVGSLLTWVLLVPFFFVFMVPVAVWLRLQGRDPLRRTRRSPAHTYWVERRAQARAENIDKQFLREDPASRRTLRPVGSLPRRESGERS